ncbi:MAG: hypothetical protein DYH17_04695 [Xanthomonadales bacterium PRO6]|nr:hypothetical protein [Xanthomonadales bacterium PRO6]
MFHLPAEHSAVCRCASSGPALCSSAQPSQRLLALQAPLAGPVVVHRYPRHHTLLHLLDDWRARPRPAVAALVVATRGSSYRKPGALALIDETGLAAGCISGGCLEVALVADAHAVLAVGSALRRSYDTRGDDDRWFGSQSGCRGTTDLLLWPGDAHHPLLTALAAADDAHRWLWVDADALECHETAAAGRVAIAPPPRLLLLGGGPEAPPLLTLAGTLGWRVDVVEHRARYLADARLAAARNCIAARPAAVVDSLRLARYDAAICASHLYDEDRCCLAALADSSLGFIGLLGPPSRRDELLAELAAPARARLDGRLEAPVGLALGAHGPEAVALAMLARLTQVFARG